jgi:hypothetical protein
VRAKKGPPGPTAEEVQRFLLEEEEEEVEATVTPTATTTAPYAASLPQPLRDLPHPLSFRCLTAQQNLALQGLIRYSDKDGFVTAEDGIMSFAVGNCTPKQYNQLLADLVSHDFLTLVRRNQQIYRLRAGDIRYKWESEQAAPVLPPVVIGDRTPAPQPSVAPLTSALTSSVGPTTPTPSPTPTPQPSVADAPATPEIAECWALWKTLMGPHKEKEYRTAIHETYRTVEGKGFNARQWVTDAIHITQRHYQKEHLQDPVGYYVGVLRHSLIYGFGHIPSAEQKEIEETFGAEFDVGLSDAARRLLSQLNMEYGALKVMRILLQHSDEIAKDDRSLAYAERLGRVLERETKRTITFRREA